MSLDPKLPWRKVSNSEAVTLAQGLVYTLSQIEGVKLTRFDIQDLDEAADPDTAKAPNPVMKYNKIVPQTSALSIVSKAGRGEDSESIAHNIHRMQEHEALGIPAFRSGKALDAALSAPGNNPQANVFFYLYSEAPKDYLGASCSVNTTPDGAPDHGQGQC